jgi:hypothetical protein
MGDRCGQRARAGRARQVRQVGDHCGQRARAGRAGAGRGGRGPGGAGGGRAAGAGGGRAGGAGWPGRRRHYGGVRSREGGARADA